jgi:predicted TIM-barrel fold metal-dependent hydrolase
MLSSPSGGKRFFPSPQLSRPSMQSCQRHGACCQVYSGHGVTVTTRSSTEVKKGQRHIMELNLSFMGHISKVMICVAES